MRHFIHTLGVASLLFGTSGCTSAYSSLQLSSIESRVDQLETRMNKFEQHSGIVKETRQRVAEPKEPLIPAAEASNDAVTPAAEKIVVPEELPSVEDVQRALKGAGFYQGDIDGKMGPITKGAIREFQRVNGLQVDGDMGFQTWQLLKEFLSKQ